MARSPVAIRQQMPPTMESNTWEAQEEGSSVLAEAPCLSVKPSEAED